MKWAVVVLLLLMGSLPVQAYQPAEVIDRATLQVFQPLFSDFLQSSERLEISLIEQCGSETARAAFVEAVSDYSAVEYFRLGAMNSNNRAERLFFWPDRKGTGQKQLRRLLADPARVNVDSQSIANKSVALQGLPALERILFANSGGTPEADCIVARAIAGNVFSIAAQVHSDWSGEAGVGNKLRYPSSTSLYRSYNESIAALLTVVESGLQQISDKKLSLLRKGLSQQSQIPKNMLLWRSEQTFYNLRGNLQGLGALLLDSGLADAASTKSVIEFEFDNAYHMIDAVEESLQNSRVEIALDRLEALDFILLNLVDIVSSTMAKKLGVVTGFNASDGD